ncbi:flippase-like domain-containing protein [Micromonospora mirobrigensis]|uniref:Phosphatidic acid phosphatase type 2/haloperoxidase domain-containing protein n=1 Tax=Micromonospora mirobrigensis TaxID=262898 RepID=A0A1C4WFC5_9ACTN|nr:flippase-like domain-containing protein [Micromonospora mirobrigensis]SCE94882.1 conserved hypothetical protein [Micromonospora mirobrigensis]
MTARPHRPSPASLLSLALSGALLAALSLWARHRPPGPVERDLFRLLNRLPTASTPALVAVMSLGSYPAVLVAAATATAARRFRLALDLLLAGNLGYWSAVAIRSVVARRRPAGYLPDVRLHAHVPDGYGYPSGHVAVATALGLVLAPALPRRWRWLVWTAIGAVGLARIYVGAHLPVDVLGGLLVGWFAAGLTRLLPGHPADDGRRDHPPGRRGWLGRVGRRDVFLVVMLGVLAYLLLRQLPQVRLAAHASAHAQPGWATATLCAAAATYPLSAAALRLATAERVPLREAVLVQVAAAFANRVAPGSVGGVALGVRYLRRRGLSVPAAATAVAVTRAAGVLSVLLLLPVLLPFARTTGRHLTGAATGRSTTVLLVASGVLALVAAALAVPRLRGRVRSARHQVADAVRVLRGSGRIRRLIVVSVGLTLSYGACLWFALLAVGLPVALSPVPAVVLVCIVGEGVATAAPTPGGLGATEAALVSGLLLAGIPVATAVAGVLVYRLASFWIPVAPGYVALRLLVRRQLV